MECFQKFCTLQKNSSRFVLCNKWCSLRHCDKEVRDFHGSTAGQATDDNTIRRMRIACWIPKATDTHSECVIIVALQQHPLVARTRLVACVVAVCSVSLFRHF